MTMSCKIKKQKKSKSEVSAESSEVTEEKESVPKKKKDKKKFRLVLWLAAVIIVIFAVIIIFAFVSQNQGLRKSQKLSKKIGEQCDKAASYANTELVSSLDFSFINDMLPFDTLAESERTTSVYGVKIPEWTIFCSKNSFDKLESVTYCDFRILNKNINGIKKSEKIDTSGIHTGDTLSEVESVMNMKPYQIVYSENSTSVKYKYYCKDKQSDMINAYYITVILGKDNKVNSPVIEEENDFISEILKADSN